MKLELTPQPPTSSVEKRTSAEWQDDRMPGLTVPKTVILHVVEALGGGIITALADYVAATQDFVHHLICSNRQGHDTGAELKGAFASVRELPPNHYGAVRHVNRAIREIRPNIIHAHSSFGGFYARLSRASREELLYSPHCFAFDRRDLRLSGVFLYKAIERFLATRTGCFVAVSPHEMTQAATWVGYERASYVPNACPDVSTRATYSRPFTAVGAGRLTSQKDPTYFLDLARMSAEAGLDVKWKWIGGGSIEIETQMRHLDVQVTGWTSREDLQRQLASAQVYVHTAAWEGAPFTLLEAAATGLPLVTRSIPSLESLGTPGVLHSKVAIMERIAELNTDEASWALQQKITDKFATYHTRKVLESELRKVYVKRALAAGRSSVGQRKGASPPWTA